MRINAKRAATLIATLTRKVHWKRISIALSSHVFIACLLFLMVTPVVIDKVQQLRTEHAATVALQKAMEEEAYRRRLKIQETETMRQFTKLRLTLYCEAARSDKPELVDMARADMLAIADVVFSRIDSRDYPDTIADVVDEVRLDARSGKKVAMFSYIYSSCPQAPKMASRWKLAGLMSAIALKERWDGKPSSGNVNYHARYVSPEWSVGGVSRCQLKPVATPGAYHMFYAPVSRAERPDCLETQSEVVAVSLKGLPTRIPVPSPRPARKAAQVADTDKVKNLILVSN